MVKSKIKLYADDALLYRNINSEEDITILQELRILNALFIPVGQEMKFNPTNCECLRISSKFNLPMIVRSQYNCDQPPQYYSHTTDIEQSMLDGKYYTSEDNYCLVLCSHNKPFSFLLGYC